MEANKHWENMREHAYRKLCGPKCRGGDPGSISPFDIFFSEGALIMDPEDFAPAEDLDELRYFLKGRWECQERFLEEGDGSDWYKGIRFCVRDDLTVIARDCSRAWALFYNDRNIPRVMLVFRNDCSKVMFGAHETYRKCRSTDPVSIYMDAVNFRWELSCGNLKVWDRSLAQEDSLKLEEVFVSEGSIEASYEFGGNLDYMSCTRLTDTAVKKYRENMDNALLTKKLYKGPAGIRSITLMQPLGMEGHYYAHSGLTAREQSALTKGLPADSDLKAALKEAFLDAQRPDLEFENARREADRMAREVSRLAREGRDKILDAVLARWGYETAGLEKLDRERKELIMGTVQDEGHPCSLYFRFRDDRFTRTLMRSDIRKGRQDRLWGFTADLPYDGMDKETMRIEGEVITKLAKANGISLSFKVSFN